MVVIAAETTPTGLVETRIQPVEEISTAKLALYSLPSIPIAFLTLPVAFLMPAFYASTLHVSLTAIGGFLVVSRFADVFLDPMIGKWSDTTKSRLGRRKFWMLIGTPILMLGAFLLFIPLFPVNGWYLLVASFVIYAGGSAVGLPYSAWGTEILETYHGRSRMAAYRGVAAVVGGVLAAVIAAIAGYFGHGADRFTMAIMGVAIIVLTPLTVWIAISFVAEPPPIGQIHSPWWPSIRDLFRNTPFRLFCLSYVIFTIGGSVATSTIVFLISNYFGQPRLVGIALLATALTSVLSIPLWLRISRWIGKHRAIAYSLIVAVFFNAAITPLLQPSQGWLYVGLIAVLGVIASGSSILPLSMIGDIIDYDTLIHGKSRGGIYMGVWSFTQKASPALGIGVTLWVLNALNFHATGHNTGAALESLKYVYAFGSAPFYFVGAAVLLWFPINERRHGIIQRRLDARARRALRDGV
jgi:glycoside/pentoside/hexuronide:cation symporter, GPH family